MKRRFWIRSMAAFIGIIISSAVLLAWLLGTNDGARWVLYRAFRALPVPVTAERIDGTLAGGVTLAVVRMQLPDWEVMVTKAACLWQPAYLAFGHLSFNMVHFQGVTLLDRHPGMRRPVDLMWPRLPRWLVWLSASAQDMQIRHVVVRSADRELLKVENFRSRVGWYFGTLTLKDTALKSALGEMSGRVDVGLARPALSADLHFIFRVSRFGYDRLDIRLKPEKASDPVQVASATALTLFAGKNRQINVSGIIGLKRDGLLLDAIQIRERGRCGALTAKGEIVFSQPDPRADIQIRLTELGLARDAKASTVQETSKNRKNIGVGWPKAPGDSAGKRTSRPIPSSAAPSLDASGLLQDPSARISGNLDVKGTIRHYGGRFDLEQKSSVHPWLSGRLKGQIKGSVRGLVIKDIMGSLMGGTLAGNLDWTWQDRHRLSWALSGKELNPAKIKPAWDGKVNADTRGALNWETAKSLQGAVRIHLIDSVLHGKSLSGSLEGHWEKGVLGFVRGDFRGSGFQATAKGHLADRLDYQVHVTDLSALTPGLRGQMDGGGWMRWREGRTAGVLKGRGAFPVHTGPVIRFSQANVQWDWDEKGLLVRYKVALEPTGRLEGNFSCPGPVRFALPEEGDFNVVWRALDPGFIKSWYSEGFRIQGRLNGELQGTLYPAFRFKVTGNMDMMEGRLAWEKTSGVMKAECRHARIHYAWMGDRLEGNFSLNLASHGNMAGDFQLPLAARFPIKIAADSPVHLQVKGELREKGILSALFPGIVKESHGNVLFQVAAGGTWGKPDFRGKARLEKAGAQFPQTGLHFQDVSAEAEWLQDHIRLLSFHVRSGTSDLHGSASLWFKDWRLSRYEGVLNGDRVQFFYLPEIRIWASPDLQFSGDMKQLALKGSILISEALIRYAGKSGAIKASRDVVMVDHPAPKKAASPSLALDMRVAVVLGDKFQVDVDGLRARLGGRVVLKGDRFDRLLANGQIDVVKGDYERYGVKLDIVKGRAVFKEQPIELGSLDILALKTVRDSRKGLDVQAGVTITGILRAPLVNLYGRPAMNERDTISYMVLGRPFNENSGGSQKEQITQWAAAILAGSPSSGFPGQLKERFGIDSVGVEAGASGDMARSLVTVGKYLTPDLYVSFGRALFGDDYYVSTRYSFLKNWQIESRFGLQSGADIFYRIEFD